MADSDSHSLASAKASVASNNQFAAKAAGIDASGNTLNINLGDRDKKRREPPLASLLCARLRAKAQGIYMDSAVDQIRKVEQSDLDESAKQTFISILYRSLAHQLNLEDVIDKTVNSPNLEPDIDPEKLNPEWADEFQEHAGSKYDEEAQAIWAKLLTDELNNPGTYSRKSMRILDDMDSEDAKAFDKLCQCCAYAVDPVHDSKYLFPLFIYRGDNLEIDSEALGRLRDLGLFSSDLATGGVALANSLGINSWQLLQVGTDKFAVQLPKERPLLFETHAFTRYGIELSSLCDCGAALSKDHLFIREIKSRGGSVIQVTELHKDGNFSGLNL